MDGLARTYDAAGNTLSIGGTTREFVFDDSNRMSQVKANGTVLMNYDYNGKGEQIRRYLGTTNFYTVYDEAGHWIGDYDDAGKGAQQAIWMDDLPIGLFVFSPNGTQKLRYIEPDHLGTPRAIYNPYLNQTPWTWDLRGEAFGATPPNQDPDQDGTSFVFNLRYPGQRYDSATGLNYNYFRDYDAGSGRYVESDPIGLGGGRNTFAYTASKPLSMFDAKGLIGFSKYCNAGQRQKILEAIVELSNEIIEKAGQKKDCQNGNCNFRLTSEAMRLIASTRYVCESYKCATHTLPDITYLYPGLIEAADGQGDAKISVCGCLRSNIFHEAIHNVDIGLRENQVREETSKCVSCATTHRVPASEDY